jgi:glycosyltransferase involved in cell wall biosynthesis
VPRVLVLTPGFITPETGAQVPAIVDLFRALQARADLEIHLISADQMREGPILREGVELWPHGVSRVERGARWIYDLRRRPRFDVVWALWLRKSALWARTARRILGVPVLASVIGGEVSELPGIGYGEGGSRRGRWMIGGLLERAAAITVGSPALAQVLAQKSPALASRIEVAPLGVPPIPMKSAPAWRAADPLRLVAITRVEPVKAPDHLLETVAELHRRGRDVRLDIFGYTQNNDLGWLETKARSLGLEGRVRHLGLVRPEVVRSAYAEYSALIHASLHESQGMALIEAAVARLPIATTAVGVAAELREMGAALELGDATALGLADAVERAAGREADARSRVLARYGVEACAGRFLEILTRISA